MAPEFAAYQNSLPARVECVKCGIGPVASWFARSKLSGVGQVLAVTFNDYPNPDSSHGVMATAVGLDPASTVATTVLLAVLITEMGPEPAFVT